MLVNQLEYLCFPLHPAVLYCQYLKIEKKTMRKSFQKSNSIILDIALAVIMN